jgi:hypothetical protein
MPLRVNVGLSRKIGEPNYGSRGASVNIEAELDTALVSDPARLKDHVKHLFGLVRTTLAEELNNNHAAPQATPTPKSTAPNGTASAPRPVPNGSPPAQRSGTRMATAAQAKALWAISRQSGIDLRTVLREQFSVGRPEELSMSQASTLIDDLKAQIPAQEG